LFSKSTILIDNTYEYSGLFSSHIDEIFAHFFVVGGIEGLEFLLNQGLQP